jgi:hypothetical protein
LWWRAMSESASTPALRVERCGDRPLRKLPVVERIPRDGRWKWCEEGKCQPFNRAEEMVKANREASGWG